MNADLGFLIGIGVAAVALAVAGYTKYRYRGIPLSREEILERRVEDLEATVRILQERIRELETELEHYKAEAGPQAPPPPRRRAVSPKPKRLNGEQLKRLRVALLDTYTTHSQWQTLLQDANHIIDTVALGASLEDVAATVLGRANAEGWMGQLLAAAAETRPDLPELQALAGELKRALK